MLFLMHVALHFFTKEKTPDSGVFLKHILERYIIERENNYLFKKLIKLNQSEEQHL